MDIYEDAINQLINEQLIIEENGFVKLTKKGLFIGNQVFEKFLLD